MVSFQKSECSEARNPLVSIIIPALNSSKNIPLLIGFLEEQLLKEFETIFVVDSRSSDGTVDVISEHAPRLGLWKTIIQETDGGLGDARNIGLDNSCGKYVWFLDADDRPYPEFLSDLVSSAEENDADLAQCNFIRSSNINLPMPKGKYTVKIMDSNEALRERASERIPVTSWSFLFNRRFLLDNSIYFQTHRFSEDIDHTYICLQTCNKLCYTDKPLYLYYQSGGSMCSSNNRRGLGEIGAYEILDAYFEKHNPTFHKRFGPYSAIMRIRSATHMDLENYRKYIKSGECKRMVDKHLRDPVNPEGVVALLFPRIYHKAVNLFLEFFYYKESRLFDTRPMSKLR